MATLKIDISECPSGTYTAVKSLLKAHDWAYDKPVFGVHDLTNEEVMTLAEDLEAIEGIKLSEDFDEDAPAADSLAVTVLYLDHAGKPDEHKYEIPEALADLEPEKLAKHFFGLPAHRGGVVGVVKMCTVWRGEQPAAIWPPAKL